MASDGEDVHMTPVDSLASGTDTEEDEDIQTMQSAETDDTDDDDDLDVDLDVELVPATPDEGDVDELMRQLTDYQPTVPDALTVNLLKQAGFGTVDTQLVRLISVSAQKFISDIVNDALQHCKTRSTNIQHSSGHSSNKDKKNPKDRKYTLAMEDLVPALADHGITVRKPQYFV
ncbi:transcription initiation factor TFIID subunit 10 [Drosophila tropicalis]|uniref:transcription initiation factor TFIID subunit 10 n=1 Tax=Drosophila tropicalis TaxID=46794 RepID=UPI0035ABC0C6